MADGIGRLLTRLDIAQLGNLLLSSRFTVEGSLQGAHRSPLKGFSVEFADYRQYVPGDDLRHLDWRIYARNERLYIRQYEEECNLRVYLLVDASHSMGYGSEGVTKYAFASRLAGALAYVTVHQQDSIGLTIFDEAVRMELPARSGREHLRVLTNCLADHVPAHVTDVSRTLHRLAEQVHRRALVIVMSDLFDDLEPLRAALAHFRKRKHDVIVYHVLDQAELTFPFRDTGAFLDMETGERLMTNPRSVKHAYQEAFSAFLFGCQRLCAGLDVDYTLVTVGDALGPFVRRHLSLRQRRGR